MYKLREHVQTLHTSAATLKKKKKKTDNLQWVIHIFDHTESEVVF